MRRVPGAGYGGGYVKNAGGRRGGGGGGSGAGGVGGSNTLVMTVPNLSMVWPDISDPLSIEAKIVSFISSTVALIISLFSLDCRACLS